MKTNVTRETKKRYFVALNARDYGFFDLLDSNMTFADFVKTAFYEKIDREVKKK